MYEMDFTHATVVLECSDDVIHLLLCIVVRGIANEKRQRPPDVQAVRTSFACTNELQVEAKW